MSEGSAYLRRIAARSTLDGAPPAARSALVPVRVADSAREAVSDPFEAVESVAVTEGSSARVPTPAHAVEHVSEPVVPPLRAALREPLPPPATRDPLSLRARSPVTTLADDLRPMRALLDSRAEGAEAAQSSTPERGLAPTASRVDVEAVAAPPSALTTPASVAPAATKREPPLEPRRLSEPSLSAEPPAAPERPGAPPPPAPSGVEQSSAARVADALARMDRLLRPEQGAAASAPPSASSSEGRRVSIGKIRVEVVNERPSVPARVAPAPRAPARGATLGGVPSKLRFGLGQV